MKILAADIEANELLVKATKIHCLVVEDVDTKERYEATDPEEIYKRLLDVDRLVMHNGRMYDSRILERIIGRPRGLDPLPPVVDTLLISRLLYPDKGQSPAGGKHSLEAWGKFLGIEKKHTGIEQWEVFTDEMMERCHSDVDVQVSLYDYLMPKLEGWGESVQIEHTVATIIAKQIEHGFPIDMDRVDKLEQDLMFHRLEALDRIGEIPPWHKLLFMAKPAYYYNTETGETYKKKGDCPQKDRVLLEEGPKKYKVETTEFNPGSDHHIRRLLKEKYGWEGTVKTDTGLSSVKGEILDTLPYKEAKHLAKLSKIDKVLSYPANYRKFQRNGRVHGDVITNGCVTGRMSHSKPNMGNNPASREGEDEDGNEATLWGEAGGWGIDCRHCFVASAGKVLVGMDAKALEARMLAHYVSQWDGGEYGRMLMETDVHSLNQKLAGLDTRAEAKTFYFKFVYGGKTDEKTADKLYASCPALKKLKDKYTQLAKKEKKIQCLDGRWVPIRKRPLYGSEKTQEERDAREWGVAVNTLLQSAGAIVMKKALCIFFEDAEAAYGPHGERWGLCANVHDEFQWECDPEIADEMGQMAANAITKAGEHFKMGVRLDGEYKVGTSWAETH